MLGAWMLVRKEHVFLEGLAWIMRMHHTWCIQYTQSYFSDISAQPADVPGSAITTTQSPAESKPHLATWEPTNLEAMASNLLAMASNTRDRSDNWCFGSSPAALVVSHPDLVTFQLVGEKQGHLPIIFGQIWRGKRHAEQDWGQSLSEPLGLCGDLSEPVYIHICYMLSYNIYICIMSLYFQWVQLQCEDSESGLETSCWNHIAEHKGEK